MRTVGLVAAWCFTGTAYLLNNFTLEPQLSDISSITVSVRFQAFAPEGRLWSYTSPPGTALTATEVKAGVGKLGPETCWKLGTAISGEVEVYGLTMCTFSPGESYTFHAYIEAIVAGAPVGAGTFFSENFTVPPDPWPLPYGAFCFDVDADYLYSAVGDSTLSVVDAGACQALCQASPSCLHFRYIHSPSLPDYRNCSLLTAVRTIVGADQRQGVTVGPKSCSTRSVNFFRPHLVRAYTAPIAVRSVPFMIFLRGVNFEPQFDRMLLVPPEQPCDGLNVDGGYLVNGSQPSTLGGWAGMPCNGTPEAIALNSLLACGQPPATVVVEQVGPAKICLCDAGQTPYGCDHEGGKINYFFERALQPMIDIIGPYPNQTRSCPSWKPCKIEGIQGYKLSKGDRLMLREKCSPVGRPVVQAYTNASLATDRPFGLLFEWPDQDLTLVDCITRGPYEACAYGRICYCPAAHGCTDDGNFSTDAGEVAFFGEPAAPEGLKILQEDYESFTMFWNYPTYDGGGPVLNYALYFKTCPRGGIEDGAEARVVIPAELGDNSHGRAPNATHQFRSVSYGYYSVDVQPATRYCVRVSSINAAGEGRTSGEFVWLTDVQPPRDLRYPDPPLFLVQGVPMATLAPTVLTQDCRNLPTVTSLNPHLRAEDCNVQWYDVSPPLPAGLNLDPRSGNISGTPAEISPRPEICMVTATNEGGKSSFFLSIAAIGLLKPNTSTVSMCLSSYQINDATITFQTQESNGLEWYNRCEGHPQSLRLTTLDSSSIVIFQSSGEELGHIPREEAVPCGRLVLDTWSSSDRGFPPPGLCFWESRPPHEARVEILFQGGHAFEPGTWYQLVLRLRVAVLTPLGTAVLRLDLLCSEESEDETLVNSAHLGVWTPADALPRWRPKLSLVPPTPLATPVQDLPWVNGQPYYLQGFQNRLLGEAPFGEPFPWGFPAPGNTTCYNSTSVCPTSPHQFVNTPGGTMWYTDVDFPSFMIATGTATLLTPVLTTMRFTPFMSFSTSAVPRPEVALGNRQPTRVRQQEFTVDFALAPDSKRHILLERLLAICPSSPLQWPMMGQGPRCEISAGPVYVGCTCESSLPENHVAARCDRLVLSVSEELEIRSRVTATLKIASGKEPSFAGFLPIKWSGQVKSKYGGMFSFRKTSNAGLDVWPDFVLQGTAVEACAQECLRRLQTTAGVPVPCRSFKFHKLDRDCYLSQHVESEFNVLKQDWPGDPFDNYEHQEQVVSSIMTPEHLFYPGVFFSDAVIQAESPAPSPSTSNVPAHGSPHFFPSYTGQLFLIFSVEIVPIAPIYGQDPWRSKVIFQPPSGFRPATLRAFPGAVPTPQGLGYCGDGGGSPSCNWFLSKGQTWWPPSRYRFEMTVHNPPDPGPVGQPWSVRLQSSGFSVTGAVPKAMALDVPHPLPVEGKLRECSVHFAAVRPVLPSGRLSNESEDTVDIFFTLPRPWRSGSTLQILMPNTFVLPSACQARPLTPWLTAAHLACTVNASGHVLVDFAGPLLVKAAVGLRLVPFQLPTDVAALDLHPLALSIRLRVIQQQQEFGGTVPPVDACHADVWSCGLAGLAWAGRHVALRPARHDFASLTVHAGHAEPLHTQSSWAYLEFVLNASLSFQGAVDDVLLLRPPHGYVVTGVQSSDLQVLARDPRSGQLNVPAVLQLAEAVRADAEAFILWHEAQAHPGDIPAETSASEAPEAGSMLYVRQLHGAFLPGERYHLNISFKFPASGIEPSLLNPTRPEPGRSGCANAWGLALESGGDPLATGFTPAEPLAFIAQFYATCSTPVLGADNVLTLHFVTTQRALPSNVPKGSMLLLVFSLPAHFDLRDPAVAADFFAPFWYNASRGAPILGSAAPESPAFRKFGCPRLVAFLRGRRLRTELHECAVHFNDVQDMLELALVIRRLPAAAAHELLLPVRNPEWTAESSPPGHSSTISLSIFRTAVQVVFSEIPAPFSVEGHKELVRLQHPLKVAACGKLLQGMKAAIERSLCVLDGRRTEVTVSFLLPAVLQEPISASIIAPTGYTIPWTCNSSVSELSLPNAKRFEPLGESMMADCVVSLDGRTASFTIRKSLKAHYIWHYFTIHARNPSVESAPATHEQNVWSLVVGEYAAGGEGTIGMPGPPLRVLTDLEIRELPFTYNSTSWALKLQFRSTTSLPAGGFVLLRAPPPFAFPGQQCWSKNATDQTEPPGSPTFVPTMPASPFLPILEIPSAAPGPNPGRLPGEPSRAFCILTEPGLLVVSLLDSSLPAGLYELRFAVTVDPEDVAEVTAEGAWDGPLAPLRWAVETWHPASVEGCSEGCCPERRPNFRADAGMPELELAERGIVEAYPSGSFLHRQLVPDRYRGWRFSNGSQEPFS